MGRSPDLHLAHQRPHRSDPAEIRVAREVVAARPHRLGGRQQAGGGADRVARPHRLRRAVGDPHPSRTLPRAKVAEALDPHDQPRTALPLVESFDKAGERADGQAGQHRPRDGGDPPRGSGVAEEQGGEGEHQRERDRTRPKGRRDDEAEGGGDQRRSEGGFSVGCREEDQDA